MTVNHFAVNISEEDGCQQYDPIGPNFANWASLDVFCSKI